MDVNRRTDLNRAPAPPVNNAPGEAGNRDRDRENQKDLHGWYSSTSGQM
jgi:hypothetical protein